MLLFPSVIQGEATKPHVLWNETDFSSNPDLFFFFFHDYLILGKLCVFSKSLFFHL